MFSEICADSGFWLAECKWRDPKRQRQEVCRQTKRDFLCHQGQRASRSAFSDGEIYSDGPSKRMSNVPRIMKCSRISLTMAGRRRTLQLPHIGRAAWSSGEAWRRASRQVENIASTAQISATKSLRIACASVQQQGVVGSISEV